MSLSLLGAIAVSLAGFAVWTRRLRDALRITPPPAQLQRGQTVPVSIIVPARNEAHNLPPLLESLRQLDPAPLEVIVVDDHSSDGTGDVARRAGVRVVEPPPLPPGWIGKPWACRAGGEAARGDYLLFTDADTIHAPDSLARVLARQQETNAALLSVIPTHRVGSTWEKLQGVFWLLILIATRAGGSKERAPHERRFSIGQYLFFTREAYEKLGRHERVKHRVAEDLLYARMVCAAGMHFETLSAPGLLQVRMYPEGLGAFVRGWRRNFREGIPAAGPGGMVEMCLVMGWLVGIPLFAVQAALAGSAVWVGAWLAAYGLTSAEVARRQRQLGPLPAWGALAHPAFAFLFLLCSSLSVYDALRGAPVLWKGRSVARGAEPEDRSSTRASA